MGLYNDTQIDPVYKLNQGMLVDYKHAFLSLISFFNMLFIHVIEPKVVFSPLSLELFLLAIFIIVVIQKTFFH